jgi:cell division protein FtsW (lipid II flippase)
MKRFMSAPVKKGFSRFTAFVTMLLLSFYSFAQDKKVDVSINTKPENDSNFFMQPWVWVVGGAVFLLLLVALLRNNSSSKT